MRDKPKEKHAKTHTNQTNKGQTQRKKYKGNPIRLIADLSAETLQARREWQDIFKVLRGKTYNQDYCTRQGSHSK